MKSFQSSAPGKIILFGEHAVVYQRPAIAIPIHQVQATVTVSERESADRTGIFLDAPQINLHSYASELLADHPMSILLSKLAAAIQLDIYPDVTIHIHSTIPIASGMGSGAAITIAVVRALLGYLDTTLSLEQTNSIAYQVEKKYHGTPSGIDNTVITYEKPIYFLRGSPFHPLHLAGEFTLVIADSGIPSSTLEVVADVRRGWQEETQKFEAIFDQIGLIVQDACKLIEHGPIAKLGSLMNSNQVALRQMGVSSPRLDYLVDAANFAGALGAKISGAGRGGNIIALVEKSRAEEIALALRLGGAKSTIITTEVPLNIPE
jgi:mevalonate kinase